MKIDVSIIVPIYNVEKYLAACIESLLIQNEVNIEIILIDDESTDSSSEICQNYCKKYSNVKYIRQQNSGPGKARENGVNHAKGKYLFFSDADDYLEAGAIYELFLCAEESDADIVLGNIAYHSNISNDSEYSISKIRIVPDMLYNISEKKELIYLQRLFLWGKLYKRSVLMKSGVTQPAHFYEDTYAVPCIASKAETMYYKDTTVYHYFRNRPGNTINNLSRLNDLCISLKEIVEFYKSNNLFDLYKKQLKYLILSQLRFAYRKFSNQSDIKLIEMKNDYINRIKLLLNNNFDYWCNTADIKIAVIENIELVKSTELMTLTTESITYYKPDELYRINSENTDLIILDKLYNGITDKNIRILAIDCICPENQMIRCIEKNNYFSDDIESQRWNLADEMLNKLNESWEL